MSDYSLKDIIQSANRYKLYILMCKPEELSECINSVLTQKINVINIGKELATFIDGLEDFRYLNIDVYDYTKKLLNNQKSKINGVGNDVIAIYNLGILMEPNLEINAEHLLKEFSKSTSLIILWENRSDIPERLNWSTQKNNIFFDFSETQIKKMQYAI
jgi:hypothetical protein